MTRLEALTALKEAVEAGNDPGFDFWVDAFFRSVFNAIEAFNGSLDAARAIHEAVLPRHYAQLHIWPMPEMSRVDIGGGHTGRSNCPARAWLLAILSALVEQERTNDPS